MSTYKYLAHIAEDGREQTVCNHLEGTASLCSSYAGAIFLHGRVVAPPAVLYLWVVSPERSSERAAVRDFRDVHSSGHGV